MNSANTDNMQWRILCVDDEPDVLEILRTALSLKHEVVTASDGLEAVGLLDLCEADFVLCDVRMPKMDGFQTVEAIRRHPLYTEIPVFFLTAETSAVMAKRGFASGANLYLTKPFDPMRVLDNIDYFLNENALEPRPKRLSVAEVAEEAKRPAAAPRAAAEAPAAPSGKARAIVVCHDKEQLDNICRAIESKIECVACADPLAALNQLFRYDPDILIVNPAIPHLSGWGLVRLIRQNPQFRALPIILMEDPSQAFDPRLLPAVTDQPPLPHMASHGKTIAALGKVMSAEGFEPRPKRTTFEEIQRSETALRRDFEREQGKRQAREQGRRDRYERIQSFINQNLSY